MPATAAPSPSAVRTAEAWWHARRDELLTLATEATPHYVYDMATAQAAAERLRSLAPIARVFYAVKANPHPALLRTFHDAGLGFECVSPGEIAQVFDTVPDLDPARVLFTPNFAPRADYDDTFAHGVRVTLDNAYGLDAWPETFADRDLFLRIDPGEGYGHHAHVRTAGVTSKFGIAPEDLPRAAARAREIGARIVGLHAHVGSGVDHPTAWIETAETMARIADLFPEVRVFDLGGGLPVPSRPGAPGFDVNEAAALLQPFHDAHPEIELWLEPGRYLAAEAGVLLARVTQLKSKGEVTYVGVDAGMHTLLRPALYGAYHAVVNLTRLGAPTAITAEVVGPICETGDVLARARALPETQEGDVLLIATAGAYGQAMASRYNLREPARETVL
ncbi:MAG: hypothetical protein AAF809_01015 [Bacteroidota bacterium]